MVTAGSGARKKTTKSLNSNVSYKSLRDRLIAEGIITDKGGALSFSSDYEFSSPSAAASVLYGNPMNGRTRWKTAEDKTLKELQEDRLERIADRQRNQLA